MSAFHNPLAPRRAGVPDHLRRIKAWVRETLGLDDAVSISVAELACREEGCPDIETAIGIMRSGEPIQTIRIHKPLAEIAKADIETACHGNGDP